MSIRARERSARWAATVAMSGWTSGADGAARRVMRPVSPRVVSAAAETQIEFPDNRLLIGTKKGSWSWTSRDGVDVYVTVPALTAAIISGSGDMDIDRVSGPFSGRVSGSGDMEVAKVNAPTLNLAISGSGDIGVAAGTCGTGTYATTGSGDIDAGNVRCTTVAATVTGSGDIDGFATGTATLRVTGSGDIEVKGGARCTTSTTGSGTTRCS